MVYQKMNGKVVAYIGGEVNNGAFPAQRHLKSTRQIPFKFRIDIRSIIVGANEDSGTETIMGPRNVDGWTGLVVTRQRTSVIQMNAFDGMSTVVKFIRGETIEQRLMFHGLVYHAVSR